MDLESLARELKMLASKEKLTAPELDRAKNLNGGAKTIRHVKFRDSGT